jgi:hypothetical protein
LAVSCPKTRNFFFDPKGRSGCENVSLLSCKYGFQWQEHPRKLVWSLTPPNGIAVANSKQLQILQRDFGAQSTAKNGHTWPWRMAGKQKTLIMMRTNAKAGRLLSSVVVLARMSACPWACYMGVRMLLLL